MEQDLSIAKSVFKKKKPVIVITGEVSCGEYLWHICLRTKIEGEPLLIDFIKSNVAFETLREAFVDAKSAIEKCTKYEESK